MPRYKPTEVTLAVANNQPNVGDEEFEFYPFNECIDTLTAPLQEIALVVTKNGPINDHATILATGETIED